MWLTTQRQLSQRAEQLKGYFWYKGNFYIRKWNNRTKALMCLYFNNTFNFLWNSHTYNKKSKQKIPYADQWPWSGQFSKANCKATCSSRLGQRVTRILCGKFAQKLTRRYSCLHIRINMCVTCVCKHFYLFGPLLVLHIYFLCPE